MIETASLGLHHRHAGRHYQHIPAENRQVSIKLTEDQISSSATTQIKSESIPKPEDLPRRTRVYLLIRPGDIHAVTPVAMLSSLNSASPGFITHLSNSLDGKEPFAKLSLMTGDLHIAICRDIANGRISLQAYEPDAIDRSSYEKWKVDFDKSQLNDLLGNFENFWCRFNLEKVKARGDSHIILFKAVDPSLA